MTHKFTAGAEVFICSGSYETRYHPTTIAKVYKNGNFTLVGEAGQWRQDGSRAGSEPLYIRTLVILADDSGKEKARAAQAKALMRRRHLDIFDRMRRIKTDAVTDAFLDAMETALNDFEAGLRSAKRDEVSAAGSKVGLTHKISPSQGEEDDGDGSLDSTS